MPDDLCHKRLSALETYHAEAAIYRKMREESENQSDLRREILIDEVREDIAEIKQYMGAQKSFVGAVVFVIGGMFAVVSMFADKLFR